MSESQTFKSTDGKFEIAYVMKGAGQPILMIHGYCMDHHLWDAQIESLAWEYQVIAVDMPGHGVSPPPPPVFSFEELAQAMLELLSHLGIDRAHIAGMSMGGFTAIRMALAAPTRVRSLAMIATAPRAEVEPAFAGMVDSLHHGGRKDFISFIVEHQMEPGTIDRDPGLIRDQIKKIEDTVSTDTMIYFGRSILSQTNLLPRLNQLTCPVVVIHGTADSGIPVSEAEGFSRRLSDSRLVLIPGGGHNINIQSADDVTEALQGFYSAFHKKSSQWLEATR
jgi:pimeloyl-ACP methyl ester carboxylesterase